MRVAVMGTGALGGYFGGILARDGEDVAFVARGATLEAIRANGLSVRSRLAGDFTVRVPVTDDPATIGPVDLVLVGVKAYDLDEAAARCRPLVGPETIVLPLQNGIDAEERLGAVLGRRAAVGAVVYVSAQMPEPGVVTQTGGPGQIIVGELDGGTSPRLKRLRAFLDRRGIAPALHADIGVALWEKFVTICGFSGVTALTRLPLGAIAACPETRELLHGVLAEVAAVAAARGIRLPEGCVEETLAMLTAPPMAELRGSLAHDLAAGRRLELETLNGTVVRLGRELGVETPLNFAVYAALKPYEDGAPPA